MFTALIQKSYERPSNWAIAWSLWVEHHRWYVVRVLGMWGRCVCVCVGVGWDAMTYCCFVARILVAAPWYNLLILPHLPHAVNATLTSGICQWSRAASKDTGSNLSKRHGLRLWRCGFATNISWTGTRCLVTIFVDVPVLATRRCETTGIETQRNTQDQKSAKCCKVQQCKTKVGVNKKKLLPHSISNVPGCSRCGCGLLSGVLGGKIFDLSSCPMLSCTCKHGFKFYFHPLLCVFRLAPTDS